MNFFVTNAATVSKPCFRAEGELRLNARNVEVQALKNAFHLSASAGGGTVHQAVAAAVLPGTAAYADNPVIPGRESKPTFSISFSTLSVFIKDVKVLNSIRFFPN